MSAERCLICGASELRLVEAFSTFRRVTSDFRPWPAGGEMAVCMSCATTQKIASESWREDCRRIYADYVAYRQGPEAEQSLFLDGKPVATSRSRVFLGWALEILGKDGAGRVLDFGCGDGSLLRNFAAMAPGWRLSGYDLGTRYRDVVMALPGAEGFHTGAVEALPSGFDLVTASHVVEHLDEPAGILSRLAAKLSPSGALAIDVPDLARNPFDVLIADHALHFTRATFDGLLRRAGLRTLGHSDALIPKELVTLARRGPPAPAAAVDPASALAAVEAHLEWVGRLRAAALAAAAAGPVAVFGSAIAATWLDAELDERSTHFVDEDPRRQNSPYRGRLIVAPGAVPKATKVVVPLPAEIAPAVIARLQALGLSTVSV